MSVSQGGVTTLSSLVATTADINGGTVDGITSLVIVDLCSQEPPTSFDFAPFESKSMQAPIEVLGSLSELQIFDERSSHIAPRCRLP